MTRALALAAAALACALLALAPAASAKSARGASPAAGVESAPGAKPAARAPSAPGNPIAPVAACANQTEAAAPTRLQVAAMLCMTNYARAAYGLAPLAESPPLAGAAAHKTADMLTCNRFSHEACGRQFTYWMGRYGYLRGCWSAAENIAWGTGSLGTVRRIFSGWMHSPGHRANILGPYAEIGISFAAGTLEGNAGATVWTQDFGARSC